jgi:hypothetical protein
MKIVSIFGDRLFSFHFEGETKNELRRLLSLWNNTEHLYQFVVQHKADLPGIMSTSTLVNQLVENANDIEDSLFELSTEPERSLGEFFMPLENHEFFYVKLSKQKGKKNYLRVYAIKIDENCFVITGGAIKFHHLNKERQHTQDEMIKINKCREYLKDNGVFDADSFYEFLNQ